MVFDAEAQIKGLNERHEAVQKARCSQWNYNYASKGTANANYMGFKAQNASSTLNSGIAKPDLRSASFSMGTEATHYMSSYKDCHNQAVVDNKLKPEPGEMTQKERVSKARANQFTYGSDVPTYQSLTKAAFVPHSMDNDGRAEAKEFSKKIRQSHVRMGNDGNYTQIETQPERDPSRLFDPSIGQKKKEESIVVKPVANNNQKSNFTTAHQKEVENRFLSLNKQAMNDAKKNDYSNNSPESKAKMEAFKKDIRGAHFSFGT